MNCRMLAAALIVIVLSPSIPPAYAQRGQRAGGPPPTAKAAAPIDLTGTWVSIVSEDWRWRMVTPPKGDFNSIPLNVEGRRVANEWDPAKDQASGNACKAYGAPAIMRLPGRLRVAWADDNTLKIDIDTGTQTRILHFGESQAQPAPSLQGHSVARWEIAGGQGNIARSGDLKVVTTRLQPGYLRKNGIPYSEGAVVTEYFHRMVQPNGEPWIVLLTTVEDPKYLNQMMAHSTQFKKVPDGSGWNPTPCSAS